MLKPAVSSIDVICDKDVTLQTVIRNLQLQNTLRRTGYEETMVYYNLNFIFIALAISGLSWPGSVL